MKKFVLIVALLVLTGCGLSDSQIADEVRQCQVLGFDAAFKQRVGGQFVRDVVCVPSVEVIPDSEQEETP